MHHASENRQLGEYVLQQLVEENAISRTWLAEQTSIARKVLVDELRADQENSRDEFLADIRAKASIDHPLIGSVYEAVDEPGRCFYAHELLPGTTLAERLKQGNLFLPVELVLILQRVAEAQLQHEALNHATSAMDLNAVYQDDHGVIRLKNLAIAGSRTSEQSTRDIVHFGQLLLPLVAQGKPGTTRMYTLLSWMRGENLAAPITWEQVRNYGMEIEHQLAGPVSMASEDDVSQDASRNSGLWIALATTIVLLVIGAVAYKMRPPAPSPPPRTALPQPIAIAAGKYPTPDGGETNLPKFRIAAHEVTIGQYADFLETLQLLAKDKRQRIFDSSDQPKDKASHEPTAWAALLAAAKTRGIWQNHSVTLDSPVVGVDWWDAKAYAEWKKARLPSQEEWFAALSIHTKLAIMIPTGAWVDVTSPTGDCTSTGLIGMAGSVAEWTSGLGTNPANPLGDRRWVIIGGSFLKSGSNALTREWTLDRSLRRADLGFRVVFDES